jgi:succinate dehydrogenase/fumarate reductase-like Fe-S protein
VCIWNQWGSGPKKFGNHRYNTRKSNLKIKLLNYLKYIKQEQIHEMKFKKSAHRSNCRGSTSEPSE